MAQQFSFDVVSTPNFQEIDNSINMTMKEISQRFDFKGSVSSIVNEANKKLIIVSDDEFKMKSVVDMLQGKFVKRGVSLKFFEYGKMEQALGGTIRQEVTIRSGIQQEKAKEINKLIKEKGFKVQTQIMGDQIRVSSKSKDDLQAVMQLLRTAELDIALNFTNYR